MHTLDRAQTNTHSLSVNDSPVSVTDAYTHTGCVGGRPTQPPCYCGRPPGRRHDPECPAKPYQGPTLVAERPETASAAALSRNTGRLSGRRRRNA